MSVQSVSAHHVCHARLARRYRGPSTFVRDTLLAPPSRLRPEEAAVLSVSRGMTFAAKLEWFAPGFGDTTGQPPLELRA